MRIPVDLLCMRLFKQIGMFVQRLFGCGPIPTDLVKVLVKDFGGVSSYVGPEMESSSVRWISYKKVPFWSQMIQYFSIGFSLNQDKWKL